MDDVIVNKIAESGLITINLEDYYPREEIIVFDLKDHLFMGLILKEKDFREALKNTDWSVYSNKIVTITCSIDAIIPMWANMLVANQLQPFAKEIVFGDKDAGLRLLYVKNLSSVNVEEYRDKRVVVKGCGDLSIPENAYVELTRLLTPVVKSIMYGEACSTVPIYKRKS